MQQCGIVIAWSSLGVGADITCPSQTRTHTIYNKQPDCTQVIETDAVREAQLMLLPSIQQNLETNPQRAQRQNTNQVMELVGRTDAVREAQLMLLPEFMHGFIHELFREKWNRYARSSTLSLSHPTHTLPAHLPRNLTTVAPQPRTRNSSDFMQGFIPELFREKWNR